LEALRAGGAWDDTVVVFTSDHAEMLGDHGLMGKGGFYDQSQHVPLIVRVPGVPPSRVDAFTESVDLFPTLLELMGVEPTHVPDGRSLLPLMRGKAVDGRDTVHWEFDFRDVPGQKA